MGRAILGEHEFAEEWLEASTMIAGCPNLVWMEDWDALPLPPPPDVGWRRVTCLPLLKLALYVALH